MLVQYGPVNLNLTRIEKYDRVPVYQGPNYLYTRHTLTVEATFNPCTQADVLLGSNPPRYDGGNSLNIPVVPNQVPNQLPGPVGPLAVTTPGPPRTGSGGPGFNSGLPGAVSCEAVKHLLSQPRQVLVFSVGGVVVLRSPFPGMDFDANNGPLTRDVSVTKQAGTRTWKVRFTVETDVNEAPLRGSTGNILHCCLSHRWEMEHVLDEHFFTKRVITGRLVFRSDVLDYKGLEPDDFRKFFFFPIPKGWKREAVQVKALDDQNTIDYRVEDRQLPVGWQQANVTRVQASHKIKITKENLESLATNEIFKFIEDLAANLARLGGVSGGKGIGKGSLAVLGVGAAMSVVKVAYSALPTMLHTVSCEVWGGPTSNRKALRQYATGIVQARLQAVIDAGLALQGLDWDVTDDITGKQVRVVGTMTSGPTKTNNNFISPQGFPASVDALMGDLDGTGANPGFLRDGNANTPFQPGGPPDDGLSRGNYLKICIAGALTGDAATGTQALANPPEPADRQEPDVTAF